MSTAEYQEERIESEVSWCIKHDTSIEEFKQNCSFKYENGNYLLSANPSGCNEISIETDGQTYISIESNYATEKYYINEKEKCQYLIDYFNKYTFKKSSNEEDYSEFDVAKYKEKLVEEMKNNIPKNQTYNVNKTEYELPNNMLFGQTFKYINSNNSDNESKVTTYIGGNINAENFINFGYRIEIYFDIERIIMSNLVNVSKNDATLNISNVNYNISSEYVTCVKINYETIENYSLQINKYYVSINLNDDGTYDSIYELDYSFKTDDLEFSYKGFKKTAGTYIRTLNEGQVNYSETPLTREENIIISNLKFKDDFNNLYILPDINYKTNEISFSQDYSYFETVKDFENMQ